MHKFPYLKKKPKLSIYLDPSLLYIEYGDFQTKREDFIEQYRDAEEPMPYDMPRPRGRPVMTPLFVDALHAANKKTRRSHTGILFFLNRAPILWYRKMQQTVESSTFSSEFIALRAGTESAQHMRFKLRMFRVPIAKGHATNVCCDNESFVNNSTKMSNQYSTKSIHQLPTITSVGRSRSRCYHRRVDSLRRKPGRHVHQALGGNHPGLPFRQLHVLSVSSCQACATYLAQGDQMNMIESRS
jgi:hypothetical protein